jgi:hypothetical protein
MRIGLLGKLCAVAAPDAARAAAHSAPAMAFLIIDASFG